VKCAVECFDTASGRLKVDPVAGGEPVNVDTRGGDPGEARDEA
jgi:hypothetical protein